ncbi:MAG TPA: hypothetical protein VKT76_14865 [Bradyrhizobium sp.]|nr:hypothetical protein [Bradyrhizobium sp.]
MTDGLLNVDSTGPSGSASLAGGAFSNHAKGTHANRLRTAIGWLPTAVIFVVAAWLLADLAFERSGTRFRSPLAMVPVRPAPATVGLTKSPSFDPSTSEAIVPEEPAPADGVKISSQSWHRGGLGSNAFVTMTLRNNNEYAVKDVEISCAFLRPDGGHLTDRTRVIPDAINMKSRKTFVRLHIGFVNVNATKAKCSLLAASHI